MKKKAEKTAATAGTQAEQAYRALKQAILRGEIPEGSFLEEAGMLHRFGIGRTPFREACNRLHNEQLLEVVPRRGFYVPEMSFRSVRDLLETRLVLEGIAAELAATRAEPKQLEELERLYHQTLRLARRKDDMDALIGSNTEFHLQLARMSQNRELEVLLKGLLERASRLFYIVFRWSAFRERDAEDLLKPIVEAIRRRDPKAAHEAVIEDITRGQLNVLGRDLWGEPAVGRQSAGRSALLMKRLGANR